LCLCITNFRSQNYFCTLTQTLYVTHIMRTFVTWPSLQKMASHRNSTQHTYPRGNSSRSSQSCAPRITFFFSILPTSTIERRQGGPIGGTLCTGNLRYRKDFFQSLSIEEGRRRNRKIPWSALVPLKLSPWQKLLASRNNQTFIKRKGFDCASFDRLLDKFAPEFNGHTPFDESGYIVEFKNIPRDGREKFSQQIVWDWH
jgi:hypothetical protein